MRALVLLSMIAVALLPATPAEAVAQELPTKLKCDPYVNTLASLTIPGWGQWLNDQPSKALLHTAIQLGFAVATVLLAPTPISPFVAVGIGLWPLISAYDAYTTCMFRHLKAKTKG